MAKNALTNLDTALQQLLEATQPLAGSEPVPLMDSRGRVLANDVTVPFDVPPADNSSVDGYAVRYSDLDGNSALPVSARIPAGAAPTPLAPGTMARIFTGAEVPDGADAVVMQEQTEQTAEGVRITSEVTEGQNIRRRGQDLASGATALPAGTLIRPQEMGLLASVGISTVQVRRKLKVAVFSTGDELVEPGQPLGPGKIYNTNRFTLAGLLTEVGCEVTVCETLKDDRAITRDTLTRAAKTADLMITSGGVSVGEEDHVRAVLEQEGALSLWRLAMKPGKPLAYGTLAGTPVLGLPGNPAAVLVTFLMVAMPVIRKAQGRQATGPLGVKLPTTHSVTTPSIRREFVRARRSADNGVDRGKGDEIVIDTYPNQSSGILSSACWADGLAVVPENSTVTPGDRLTFYSFADLLS